MMLSLKGHYNDVGYPPQNPNNLLFYMMRLHDNRYRRNFPDVWRFFLVAS
jgi:hypothetical protein